MSVPGPKPEKLDASICFPLYPSKQTSPVSSANRKTTSRRSFSTHGERAFLSLSLAKEKDHGRPRKCDSYCQQAPALEQGQADRGKAAAALQTCLVDSDEAPDRGSRSRPCDVQSGNRQQ